MLTLLFIIALCGLLICIYGDYIERSLQTNPLYHPVCDISDRVSCTATFKSPYGKLLGIKNMWVGMATYGMICILAYLDMSVPIFYISLCLVIISIGLGYLLLYKIKSFCPLCIALYII